jgi:cyclopropane fatty-acyl-phospholipid synthase-like methyltransferase
LGAPLCAGVDGGTLSRPTGEARVDSWQHGLRAAPESRLRRHLCLRDPTCMDIGRPQRAFDHLAKAGDLVGNVLDPGCCTGEHALLAASLDHQVLGIDLSAKAIELAITKATERGVEARFLVADALLLDDLGEEFDTVLECGLFHILDDRDRKRYVDSLAAVVRPGGRYHMLCFSDLQPGDWGPRRVTQEEIQAAFSEGWEVESIEATVIDLTWDLVGAHAWQVEATRK